MGAMTLSIATFSITTLSITTISILTFSITMLSIKGLYATLSIVIVSINDTHPNNALPFC